MADMLVPYTIGNVLRDISSALGLAARTIVETSSTPIGTLAVKTAQLTVDFDILSSQTTDQAEVGLRIRPGTLGVGMWGCQTTCACTTSRSSRSPTTERATPCPSTRAPRGRRCWCASEHYAQ